MIEGKDLTKNDCEKLCRDEFMHMDQNELIDYCVELNRNSATFMETYIEWWNEQSTETKQKLIDQLKLGQ